MLDNELAEAQANDPGFLIGNHSALHSPQTSLSQGFGCINISEPEGFEHPSGDEVDVLPSGGGESVELVCHSAWIHCGQGCYKIAPNGREVVGVVCERKD